MPSLSKPEIERLKKLCADFDDALPGDIRDYAGKTFMQELQTSFRGLVEAAENHASLEANLTATEARAAKLEERLLNEWSRHDFYNDLIGAMGTIRGMASNLKRDMGPDPAVQALYDLADSCLHHEKRELFKRKTPEALMDLRQIYPAPFATAIFEELCAHVVDAIKEKADALSPADFSSLVMTVLTLMHDMGRAAVQACDPACTQHMDEVFVDNVKRTLPCPE